MADVYSCTVFRHKFLMEYYANERRCPRENSVFAKRRSSNGWKLGCDNYFQYLSNIRRKLLSSRRKLISRGGLGEEAEERLLSDGSHWLSPLSICATLDLSTINKPA